MSAPIDEAREPMTTEHVSQLVNLARAVRAMWGRANKRKPDMVSSGSCAEADAIVRLGEEVLALRAERAEHAAALVAARREGAEAMREACMEACRAALCDPSDIAIIGRVADEIRALPLDGDGGAR